MTATPPQLATDDDPAPLRVRQPSDFVTLVPYLLGFRPEESVVAVMLSGGELALTARLDLPDPAELEQIDALGEEILRLLAHVSGTDLVLVGFGEHEDGQEILAELARHCGEVVVDALWVSGGRWWSVTCTQGCCPAEGRPYEPSSHPLAAQAVVAGLSPAGSRRELAALAAGPEVEEQPRLERLAERIAVPTARTGRRARQRRMDRLVSESLGSQVPPNETRALTLAVLTADVMVRDIALARMSRADAHDHVALWSAVVRHTPDVLAAGPLCLLGIAGWLSGSGALLNCSLERLDELGQDYSLAEICRDISERALPPRTWDILVAGLRDDPELWA